MALVIPPAPPVDCKPHKATATARVVKSRVVGATIADSGCGYTKPPLVVIYGGGGRGARATAVITDGRVTAIKITRTGFGYKHPPHIFISSPRSFPRKESEREK